MPKKPLLIGGLAFFGMACTEAANSDESSGESDQFARQVEGSPVASSGVAANTTDAPRASNRSACGADRLGRYEGLRLDDAVRGDIVAEVGHDDIRWLGPDTAATMDFRPDRLNVITDRNNVIARFECA